MFLPNANAAAEKEAAKQMLAKVEGWSLEIISEDLRKDVEVSVQEVQCGDPECSPIDTVITIVFHSGGRGMLGLPMMADEVTMEELREDFPTEDVLRKWHRGEEAEWPPEPEFDEARMPQLRFDIGDKVECRVGPSEWHAGTVMQRWYRESTWPNGAWAPYKILLSDGRNIFAPGDLDAIIRKQQEEGSDQAVEE